MAKIARIGVDTSKSVFQLHGVDEAEQVVLRRKVRRAQFLAFFAALEPTVVGMEACGASYHWARELRKLGHEVVLIPPQYVKAYVARGKNDAKDAEAICEAMSRPRVRKRFVAIKSEEQSAAQMLLGIRDNLVNRRTQLSNTIRGNAAEFGIVVPKGLDKIEGLLGQLAEDPNVPDLAKEMFDILGQEFAKLEPRLAKIERRLKAWHRADELSRRLAEVPTIGPIGACRLAIRITNPKAFASGRMCAAWIGLTPKDHSTAGKQKMGGITRAGDESLRATLVAGATSYIEHVMKGRIQPSPWLADLLRRKPRKLVAVALANKAVRIAWRLMLSGQHYDPNHIPAKRAAKPTKGQLTAIAA